MLSYYYCPEFYINLYFPKVYKLSRLVKMENIMQYHDLYRVQ